MDGPSGVEPARTDSSRVVAVVATLGLSPDLTACLDALRREGGDELEIVVVAQGDADFAAARARADRVLSFPRNLGFAAANDAGMAASERELVATVNDDVVVEQGWLAALLAVLDREPDVAAVQGVNLRADTGAVDGCGIAWNRWWQAVQVGRDAPPLPSTAGEREVFGVSATAAIYRREALGALPGPVFDPSLGSYYEDVDLACRLRRAGRRALVVAAARARHAGSASGRRLAERSELIYGNRYRVLARHLGAGFWPRLPWIWLRDVVDLVHALRGRGEHRPGAIVRGWARALGLRAPENEG